MSNSDSTIDADAPKSAPVAQKPFAGLSQFKPKPEAEPTADKAKLAADLDKVAEKNGFLSREVQPTAAAKPKRRRFGSAEPKVQLNIKATQAEVDRFYAMAESRGIRVLGDLLTQAMDALEASDRKKR